MKPFRTSSSTSGYENSSSFRERALTKTNPCWWRAIKIDCAVDALLDCFGGARRGQNDLDQLLPPRSVNSSSSVANGG